MRSCRQQHSRPAVAFISRWTYIHWSKRRGWSNANHGAQDRSDSQRRRRVLLAGVQYRGLGDGSPPVRSSGKVPQKLKHIEHFFRRDWATSVDREGTPTSTIAHRIYENLTSHPCGRWRVRIPRPHWREGGKGAFAPAGTLRGTAFRIQHSENWRGSTLVAGVLKVGIRLLECAY